MGTLPNYICRNYENGVWAHPKGKILATPLSLHPPSKLLFRCLAATDLLVGFVSQPLHVMYLLSLLTMKQSLARKCLRVLCNLNHPHLKRFVPGIVNDFNSDKCGQTFGSHFHVSIAIQINCNV